ncbi:TadE/TadG family type IV pilus assembly protein [Pectobacterium cacticida]|uniref:TadE/TadG family type IV pilus assembly protein n=1 Tax=Pectobacterium cacticida TaxID=69221 RepID=UPI0039872A1E
MAKQANKKNRCSAVLARFLRQERGAGTAFYVLGMMALLVTGAFIVDTMSATGDAAQIKRATDAAVLAVSHQVTLVGEKKYDAAEMKELAFEYVKNNLGLNQGLRDALTPDDVTVSESEGEHRRKRFTVTVNFATEPSLMNLGAKQQAIYSTAEMVTKPTEIAMLMPVTVEMKERDIMVLQNVTRTFIKRMFSTSDATRDNLWISLVPYSQSVNVYDPDDPDRIRRWARPGALNPRELSSLFRSGYSGLADRRIPDRRAKLLCMYRGLGDEENFFWDEPPVGQFRIYYRHDLPENGSPGAPPISWRGPNPDFDDGPNAIDTRWMVADRGCPNAALLPLTNDEDKLETRIRQFTPRFNINYAIGMSWAGAALSPNMRGAGGWGDAKLPLDFNVDGKGDGQKVIVMMANIIGNWFDTDSYNFNRNQFTGGLGTLGAREFARKRFHDLCNSFRARNIKFYFIGIRPGDPDEFSNTLFERDAVPGLMICTEGKKHMNFVDGDGFGGEGVEKQLLKRLDRIAGQIENEGGYARLVE